MTNITIGDILKVPKSISGCNDDVFAEVVGVYRNFFNVKYEWGFRQSIKYTDVNKMLYYGKRIKNIGDR